MLFCVRFGLFGFDAFDIYLIVLVRAALLLLVVGCLLRLVFSFVCVYLYSGVLGCCVFAVF